MLTTCVFADGSVGDITDLAGYNGERPLPEPPRLTKMTNHSAPDLNSIECYGGRWPDPDVPPDDPTWMYFEVDTVADVVLRTVNVFADGRIERRA
jgi:hypothetical protein